MKDMGNIADGEKSSTESAQTWIIFDGWKSEIFQNLKPWE